MTSTKITITIFVSNKETALSSERILAFNTLYYFILYSAWSRDSLEGKVSTIRAARPRNCGSNPVRGLSISALLPIQTLISLAVKRPWRKANSSYQSTAEIKNEWSYTSTSPHYLHDPAQRRLFLHCMLCLKQERILLVGL